MELRSRTDVGRARCHHGSRARDSIAAGEHMSIRVYQGPHSEGRRLPVSWQWLPWLFAGITIGGQIIWLLAEPARDFLTIATVVSFFLASVSHAWLTRGWAWTLGYVAIAAGVGGAMEAVGVATGFPFGSYSYSDTLGPTLIGVPSS